jgi:hypothetical protein
MVDWLKETFPNLEHFQITSPSSEKYNCIAWAAADATQWWWPEEGPGIYWPAEIPREETLSAFSGLFAWLGYSLCANPDYDAGFEKIALFADDHDFPTHAARQLPNGRWTSKLGRGEDIEHALFDLEGKEYGKVRLVMRRPKETYVPTIQSNPKKEKA